MLIVYLAPLAAAQCELLTVWTARYWPRSYAATDLYNSAIPIDYWLLFANQMNADLWLMKYPEHSRIVRTLFD